MTYGRREPDRQAEKKFKKFGYAFPETAASAAAKAGAIPERRDRGAARIAAGDGMLARHHFVEDDAQRPDIGFLDRPAGEDLGREVGQGAAGNGGGVRGWRGPEIQQRGRPLGGEPDVAGLDVPVQESLQVQGRQGGGYPRAAKASDLRSPNFRFGFRPAPATAVSSGSAPLSVAGRR